MSELIALLDRCHRDELLPLARHLNLRANKLGLSTLSRAIEDRLRREGGHALANIARGGRGPDYDEVARDVARSLELSPDGDIEEVEARVVVEWLARSWDELDPDTRDGMWAVFAESDEPEPGGHALTQRAMVLLGREFRFRSSALAAVTLGGASLLGVLAVPFTPFLAAGGALKAMGPRLSMTLPAVVHVATLRQQVRHRVTLGVVGSPSSGKDAAIKALFGIDSGNINPVAGSTTTVNVSWIPNTSALFVVNTPGLGDVLEHVSEEARQVLNHIDVYIYVLNSEGGVQARELADYRACLATGKPTLVALNKIDVLRERDRERYIADARVKLGGEGVEMIPCAFDPLPQLAPGPLHMEEIHAWLRAALERLGKDPEELPPLPPRSSLEP